ncbi:MAG: decarboxylase [Cyanobacteria bacterium SBLK]|nr:decarboxylase [Cyanobacteria bacterium SBLK]
MNIGTSEPTTMRSVEMLPFSAELATELLATYGSPLYVYHSDRLTEMIARITSSIPYPKTQFQFASVTNGNIELLKIFKQSGWGLHANTPGDAFLGLKAGFDPAKIVYSGSNLNSQEIELLLTWGIQTYNLDSLDQLHRFGEVFQAEKPPFSPRLGFRLNLPELTGKSRIGVRPHELREAVKISRSLDLKISGLHFYRGTGTNATDAFTRVIEPILAAGEQLPDWRYLDFGGGFGYPYHRGKVAFDWQVFGREITAALQNYPKTIALIIEPGRAAIAGCGTLLTRVVSTKWQEEKQVIGVDTTIANLSVPSVYGNYREIVSFSDSETDYLTDICGNTTYSRDYLGTNRQLPSLKRGDILAILDCGAYGYAMSSHFLHRPRPAEVLLANGGHQAIRKREDYNILLNNQLFS